MILTTVEMFSGAGLMGGGFARQGFEPVFAADIDPRCVASYNHNVADVASVCDIASVRKRLYCDVLLAGPPCQGFSTLGRRDNADARNGLSLLVAKWAVATKAKVVVIENVPQFVDSNYWAALVRKLRRHGYNAIIWRLDAYDYGVAQRRLRSFTILSRVGIPQQPTIVGRKLTVRDAFYGLPRKSSGVGMGFAPSPSKIANERFKKIPQKGDKRDVMKTAPKLCPPSWFKMGAQATDAWGRIDPDKPSNTIRCCFQNPSKGRYIHPTEDRVITLREGARLQGVPDDWVFMGDATSIARQIGNGVPVPLAEAVGGTVKRLFS